MFWVVFIDLREQVEVEAFYVQPKSETNNIKMVSFRLILFETFRKSNIWFAT